jgi:hypothetical protein
MPPASRVCTKRWASCAAASEMRHSRRNSRRGASRCGRNGTARFLATRLSKRNSPRHGDYGDRSRSRLRSGPHRVRRRRANAGESEQAAREPSNPGSLHQNGTVCLEPVAVLAIVTARSRRAAPRGSRATPGGRPPREPHRHRIHGARHIPRRLQHRHHHRRAEQAIRPAVVMRKVCGGTAAYAAPRSA